MERTVKDIPEMFSEMMILMSMHGKEEDSRNGGVLSLHEPLTVRVKHPTRRVLCDPLRNANPFFHVMEFVWMMSGSNSPDWISQFNSRFMEYADEDTGYIHGAYGHRWINYFNINQLGMAVAMLKEDPTTRRVVLGMWDSMTDLGVRRNDLPCNTHIYLRIVNNKLDMTVCNRSNDVIWGMTGANSVHMTFLQELLALELGVAVGSYRIFTNNAHVYTDLPNVEEMLETRYPVYPTNEFFEGVPLLTGDETMLGFIEQCMDFTAGRPVNNYWLRTVATPMRDSYLDRAAPFTRIDGCEFIADLNWRSVCIEWLQRKCL